MRSTISRKRQRQTHEVEEEDALLLDALLQEDLDGLEARAAGGCVSASTTSTDVDECGPAKQTPGRNGAGLYSPSMGSRRSTKRSEMSSGSLAYWG